MHDHLGGGFKHFFFHPEPFGEMIQFDEHIFQMGWNHQPGNLYQPTHTFQQKSHTHTHQHDIDKSCGKTCGFAMTIFPNLTFYVFFNNRPENEK